MSHFVVGFVGQELLDCCDRVEGDTVGFGDVGSVERRVVMVA